MGQYKYIEKIDNSTIRMPDGKIRYVDEKRYGGNGMLVWDRSRGRCEICGETENLCLHHNNGYSNKYEDLVVVCRSCHRDIEVGTRSWKYNPKNDWKFPNIPTEQGGSVLIRKVETEAEKALKNRILKRIRQEINNSFGHYFSYSWEEAIGEMLEQESKYSKLVDWIDKEIKNKMTTANCFSPADMDKIGDYTNNFFETFREQLSDIAMLTYFREVLLDDRTTTKMRENIEYSIGKVFGIHYSEYLKDYV